MNPTWSGSRPTSKSSAGESPAPSGGEQLTLTPLGKLTITVLDLPTEKLERLLQWIRVELLSRQSGRTRSIDR